MTTELIEKIEEQLGIYNQVMCSAIDAILNENVSKFPIMVATQEPIELGIQLADQYTHQGGWNVHASTLEEFVARSIIADTKIENFKEIYKSPNEQICVFIIDNKNDFLYVTP